MSTRLYDAITRHQIYLEGYKNGLDSRFDPMLADMRKDIRKALQQTGVDSVNALTKRKLNELIRKLTKLQMRRNNAARADLLAELKRFAYGDADAYRGAVETIEGQTAEEAHKSRVGAPLIGLAALRRGRTGRRLLWAGVRNSIDPATGLKPIQVINQYLGYVSRNIKQIILRAYSNSWTVNQTLAAIFGTRTNRYKDGLYRKFKLHGATMLRTVVQHVSTYVQSGVNSLFYKYYEWVSIIDGATTAICRSRDGNHYRYGKGPLPPAHMRCRSAVVPVKQGKTYQNLTYYEWLARQPRQFVDDLVGARIGNGLRNGSIGAGELGKFNTRQRLTLEQFLSKFDVIILNVT